jgi:hypothetical protein
LGFYFPLIGKYYPIKKIAQHGYVVSQSNPQSRPKLSQEAPWIINQMIHRGGVILSRNGDRAMEVVSLGNPRCVFAGDRNSAEDPHDPHTTFRGVVV